MKNIVFIVNLKEGKKQGRNTPYHFSVNSWKQWCSTNNAELFVLEDRIYDEDMMNANWHKIFALDLLESNGIEYDQVLISDADIIIHPDAPSVFEETDHKFCAVRNFGSMDWVCRSVENYSKYLFDDFKISPMDYFNSGIIIINKKHKEFYQKVQTFYLDNHENIRFMQEKFGVGTDQPVLNFFVEMENVEKKLLSYKWNMQDMARVEALTNDLLFTKMGWIYHFNAIPNNHDGKYTRHFMEHTYNTLYNK